MSTPRARLRRALLATVLATVLVPFTPAGPATAAAAFTSAITDGTNCLQVSGGTAGQQLVLGTCGQSFSFTPVSGATDAYTIGTPAAGNCVDVSGASTADNAAIIQWPCHSGNNQRWRVQPSGNAYAIVSVSSGKCVSAAGASIVQLPCTSSRVWRVPGLTPSTGPATRTVRVFWLRPSDVPFDQRYPDGIAAVLAEAQRYYRQELGRTFALNNPVVEVVTGDQVRSWYENTPNCGEKYWWTVCNMQTELRRKFGLGAPDSRWINVGEISAEGDGAGGGGGNGWVILSGHDADGAAGINGAMNRWYGGMVHELGHALGLPDSSSTDGTPMSASFYNYPNTHFSTAQKSQILSGPYGSFLS
ncbi:RICIN domain-containing protein [Actinoplanes sp. NPDC051513]|uniref:RICIN domain-containing protein n=1 Tax=Actinoplanes sp. NPDC051513 TaxID=3363908 RepID=UPI0037A22A9D